MKKILILLISLLPIITFTACDDKDDIRKDIDELNARLDALTDDLESLNGDIKKFQDMMKGTILITKYSKDEKGNYTLSLSDGTELVVYSGQPLDEIPILGVNDAGNWTYTLNGETKELIDGENNPCPAVPVDGKDGKTPTISIDADGYWCYAVGDGELKRIEGRYNIADITKIPGGIFSEVTVSDNEMTFTFDGSSTTIPLLGGLNMVFYQSDGKITSVEVGKETSIKITAKQTYVNNIIVDPTPLIVKLTETETDNLMISAKGVEIGEYTVHFQIFSKEGYRLIKSLTVTVK